MNLWQRRELFSYYDLPDSPKDALKFLATIAIRLGMRSIRPDRLYTIASCLSRIITDSTISNLRDYSDSLRPRNNCIDLGTRPVSGLLERQNGMYYQVLDLGMFAEVSLLSTAWGYATLLGCEFECVVPDHTKYYIDSNNPLSLDSVVDLSGIPVVYQPKLYVDASWFPWGTYSGLPEESGLRTELYRLRRSFIQRRLAKLVSDAQASHNINTDVDAYFIRMGDKIGIECPKLDVDIVSWDVCKFAGHNKVVLLGDDNYFCDLVCARVNRLLGVNKCESKYLNYQSSGYINAKFDRKQSKNAKDNMAFNMAQLVTASRFTGDIYCNLVQVAALYSDSHVNTPLNWLPSL